jgi:drug/metabolite transporter (DMT)-like permease
LKWVLVLLMVAATTGGDIFRAAGMRHHGEIEDFRPGAIAQALASLVRNRFVILSTCSMAVSFFAFIKLVSIAPLSFAVPVSAATFVPETILARFYLKEAVDWRRWSGAGLIMIGVILVSQ